MLTEERPAALTTYETAITTQDNYNFTQALWYQRFTGRSPPGSQCSSYNISIDEKFTTTNGLFQYTLLSIDGGRQSISYSAIPLYGCDVIDMIVDADTGASMVTLIAYVACTVSDFSFVSKTSYVVSALPSLRGDDSAASPAQAMFSGNDSSITPRNYVSLVFVISLQSVFHLLNSPFRLSVLAGDLQNVVQASVIESDTFPARVAMEGVPSCSKHPNFSTYVSKFCENNDTIPVTIMYGGPATGACLSHRYIGSSTHLFYRVYGVRKRNENTNQYNQGRQIRLLLG